MQTAVYMFVTKHLEDAGCVWLQNDADEDVDYSNVGYGGMHGGFGYGDRNADGSRILEFADGLNLVICNTLFMKQESPLVTYAAGLVKTDAGEVYS